MESDGRDGEGPVVVVDDREARSPLCDLLRARLPHVVEARLPLGDVAVGPRVILERKSLADLRLSVATGRLFRQAYELAGRVERPLLVVEGDARGRLVERTGMTVAAFRGALLSVMVGYGIPVVRTRSVLDTAAWIARLARQERRRLRAGRRQVAPDPAADPGGAMLAALPGIGPNRAARLLAAFGSVAAVLRADPAALRRVEGIGSALADYLASLPGASPAERPCRGRAGDGTSRGVREARPAYGRRRAGRRARAVPLPGLARWRHAG